MWCVVGKPNLVKCFGPRLRLWTWTLDFVPGPSFSIMTNNLEHCTFNMLSNMGEVWQLARCSRTAKTRLGSGGQFGFSSLEAFLSSNLNVCHNCWGEG